MNELDAPTVFFDLPHLDASAGELFACLDCVRHDQVQCLDRSWLHLRDFGQTVPMTMEQADPGGVSWSTLTVSPNLVSWSATNPSFST